MLLSDFQPSAAVKDFVQCYRIVHLNFEHHAQIPVKAYPPKPEQCLHFFLRDFFAIQNVQSDQQVQPHITFVGQRTKFVNQFTGRDFIDVQIVFQPTAVYRLTGIPNDRFINQHVDGTSIFSMLSKQVHEEMQHASSYPEMLSLIDAYVMRLVAASRIDASPVDLVSINMKHDKQNRTVEYWAKESCLSLKQFERKFIERVGVNPKSYIKTIRFNRAFNIRNRYPFKSWSEIAAMSGYHDYQHLAKDYQAFTNHSPIAFHSLEQSSPENVLGLTKALYHMRCREY